mmetsp:Transcript_16085/g.22213  ORF Transcript_16085/g.22213 Transcript_16085/m.22213 type:complete len:83 (-) Transcript_16085:196-444(-)|eukprot:CAMPEP_0196578976 /NCGR_PEP_ID=MMETSP1081-20130531/14772_1 /TAXON_ID=36882 /ORGANISM="Pyramimonas amylifera, Strain CCMP720" /LENGTH=82 /DNA_ID=CAMNT_0041898391 /DNA_START=108 /DNA_END=356 /DNA_ORIENTATION=-
MAQVDERAIMNQVKQEAAGQYMQELFESIRENCIGKCVTRPSSSLSSGEQQCLAKCCDRYIEATEVVTKTIMTIAAKGGGMS